MDEGSQPQPLSAVGRGASAAKNASNFNVQNEILWIKQDAAQVRNAVLLLEQEKDSLRKAIRKLKVKKLTSIMKFIIKNFSWKINVSNKRSRHFKTLSTI